VHLPEVIEQTPPEKGGATIRERLALLWPRLRWVVLGAALLGAGAAFFALRDLRPLAPLPQPPQPQAASTLAIQPPSDTALDALRKDLGESGAQLAAMQEEIARLKTALSEKPAAPEAAPPPTEALEASPGQPDQHLLDIFASMDRINGEIRALSDRLTALETAQSERNSEAERRVAYALALRELDRALIHSRPFRMQLESLAKLLAPDDPVIAELRPLASMGVPSRAELTARFDGVAAALVRADAAQAATGWAGKAYAFLQSLVLVRPLGERDGDGVPERAARAQTRLEEGDLYAAVAEVKQIENMAPEGAGWVMDAENRLQAEQGLAQLTLRLTTQLDDTQHAPHPPRAGE
jgi:hypothetical protein